MTTTNTEQLVNYIQERCLWQFFSRAWDREENIRNILPMLRQILTGQNVHAETPMERCHFANANHLARELRSGLPWLTKLSGQDLDSVIDGTIARLEEIAITRSKNGELHMQLY